MNQEERMHAHLPYKSWLDGLSEKRLAAKMKCFKYNSISPDREAEHSALIKEIVGKCGDVCVIEIPFNCDYGENIEIGENFFANRYLTILDVGKVTIGKNVQIGPNVSIYSVGHPIHPDSRNSGYEYGEDVTIGDNCWICGGVIILPGVTIGDNTVIGAGSVVTKDIPSNVVACGNPCKVIKKITEDDRKYYYKDRVFDVDDYK